MKYIEVKLTEDQANQLIWALEELGSVIRRQPNHGPNQDKQIAFIRRIIRKIDAELLLS